MAVQGNLVDISLSSLISINCNEMNQARLQVTHKGQEGTLFFDEGDIVHMSLGAQEGEDVIHELLTWEEGTFELEQNVAAPKRSVNTPWSHLLLEGLRRIDEQSIDLHADRDGADGERQKAVSEAAQRMAKDFKRNEGIDGALVSSKYGDVLANVATSNPVETAALATFTGRRAEELGILLNAGALEQILISGDKWKLIVIPHEKQFMAFSMDPKTSPGSIANAIQVTKRRHRQESS